MTTGDKGAGDGSPPASVTVAETKDMVRAALAAGSSFKMPNEAALELLADHLSMFGRWANYPIRINPLAVAALHDKTAFEAATILATAITPHKEAILCATQNYSHPDLISVQDRALAALDALTVALDAAMPHLKPLPNIGRGEFFPTGWHESAEGIARDFRVAMKSTNPSKKLGNSNDGPVAKFVAAAVLRIYGEAVTAGAVAIFLKRAAKNWHGDKA